MKCADCCHPISEDEEYLFDHGDILCTGCAIDRAIYRATHDYAK